MHNLEVWRTTPFIVCFHPLYQSTLFSGKMWTPTLLQFFKISNPHPLKWVDCPLCVFLLRLRTINHKSVFIFPEKWVLGGIYFSRRYCCNEMPPTTGRNLDFWPAHRKSAKCLQEHSVRHMLYETHTQTYSKCMLIALDCVKFSGCFVRQNFLVNNCQGLNFKMSWKVFKSSFGALQKPFK